jgi:hypothetical protein
MEGHLIIYVTMTVLMTASDYDLTGFHIQFL